MAYKWCKYFLLLFFGTGAGHLFAQDSYEVKYLNVRQNGNNVLLETKKIHPNYFISRITTHHLNSILSLSDEELRSEVEKASVTGESLSIAIDYDQYPHPPGIDFDLFKVNNEKTYYRLLDDVPVENTDSDTHNSSPFVLVRDSLSQYNWTIENEYKLIDSINCRKATMTYRCKDYVAWFDPETPLPAGPEQFGGLPGLIVELSRSGDHVSWHLQSYRPLVSEDKESVADIMARIHAVPSLSWCEYGKKLQEYVDQLTRFTSDENCKTCPSNWKFTYLECFDDCE